MYILFLLLSLNHAFITKIPKFNFKLYNNFIILDDSYSLSKISNLHLDIIEKINLTEIDINTPKIKSDIKNAQLEQYYFNNKNFSEVKITYFMSDDNQLFNSVWYPSYNYDVPILTVDILNNKTNLIFFINLIENKKTLAYENNYVSPFIKIKNLYLELNYNIIKLQNNYFISNAMIYVILNNTEQNNNICYDIIDKYIDIYLKLFNVSTTTKINQLNINHYFYKKIRSEFYINYMKNYFNLKLLKLFNL